MFIYINGKLAYTSRRSPILGLNSVEDAQIWENAYRKVLPDAEITVMAESRVDEEE
jgi:hypothetical protein